MGYSASYGDSAYASSHDDWQLDSYNEYSNHHTHRRTGRLHEVRILRRQLQPPASAITRPVIDTVSSILHLDEGTAAHWGVYYKGYVWDVGKKPSLRRLRTRVGNKGKPCKLEHWIASTRDHSALPDLPVCSTNLTSDEFRDLVDEVIEDITSRNGSTYSLLSNNCQHFAVELALSVQQKASEVGAEWLDDMDDWSEQALEGRDYDQDRLQEARYLTGAAVVFGTAAMILDHDRKRRNEHRKRDKFSVLATGAVSAAYAMAVATKLLD